MQRYKTQAEAKKRLKRDLKLKDQFEGKTTNA